MRSLMLTMERYVCSEVVDAFQECRLQRLTMSFMDVQDLPEDSQDNQKSGGRKHNVSKRSRAAAIHNMSERVGALY